MTLEAAAADLFAARDDATERFFADHAGAIARATRAMAARFHAGATLVVFGNGGPATDAQHVSVEFLHPVIVGKRALPAISLTNDIATLTGSAGADGFGHVFASQLATLARRQDIAIGISSDGADENVDRGLRAASAMGMLTVALLGGDGGAVAASGAVEHAFVVPSHDPLVVKEVHVTLYHLLWELTHVFLEQPGALDPAVIR